MITGIEIFIAGRTDLHRTIEELRSMLSEMQNLEYNAQRVALYVKTFRSFPNTIDELTLQGIYNEYIRNQADVVVFIVDSKTGTGTLQEFDASYNSFVAKKSPKIIVYYRVSRDSKVPPIEWKQRLDAIKHYWMPYKTNNELLDLVEKDIRCIIPSFLGKKPLKRPQRYVIGDLYENDRIKGIVFSVDDNGQHGKILGFSSCIKTWSDCDSYVKAHKGEWRLPSFEELNDIILHKAYVNDSLLRCKKSAIVGKRFWSSSQGSSRYKKLGLVWDSKSKTYKKENLDICSDATIRLIADF